MIDVYSTRRMIQLNTVQTMQGAVAVCGEQLVQGPKLGASVVSGVRRLRDESGEFSRSHDMAHR